MTRLRGLDALRGIAALGVAMIWHFNHIVAPTPFGGVVAEWIEVRGYTLVDLFFVISGFVFAHVYLKAGALRGTAREFVLARFARLYPLHLLTLLITAAVALTVPFKWTADVEHFVYHLLFLQVIDHDMGGSFNVPAWSLTVEAVCYGLFLILAMRGEKVFAIGALVLILLGFAWGQIGGDLFARGFVGFFVGSLLQQSRVPVPSWALVAFAAACIAFGPVIPMRWGIWLSLTAWPALVLVSLRIRFLSTAPFRWLGDISYSIYLIHFPVLVLTSRIAAPAWVLFVGSLAVVLAFSDLSYRYYETPLRKWVKQRTAQSPSSRSPALPNS